jgi:hypothetical protein
VQALKQEVAYNGILMEIILEPLLTQVLLLRLKQVIILQLQN